MRFAELHLMRYGRFEDRRLIFPTAPTDLHVIYGPNEAGKSTTMSAVGDLLFEFPHRTPYDFRFDTKLLRVGARLQDAGRDLICVRRKGQKGSTLLGPNESGLPEATLSAMLAGYTAEGFQRMFSLDHRRLREGGYAILAARDDVGQAIFAAGSGLIGVTAVLGRLEEEAKAIRSRRAGEKRYPAAVRAYEEARVRQKSAQIKPAMWDDLNRRIARLDEEIAALERLRAEAGAERERVERGRRVLPHAVLLEDAQAELNALGDLPAFAADARTVLNEVEAEVAKARLEATLARADGIRLRAEITPIVVDARLIALADDIGRLREIKGAVDKSLSDLPRRHADLRTRRASLAADQTELGWPIEDAALAKARLPRRVAVAEVRDRLEERGALEATLAATTDEEQRARRTLDTLRNELAALAPEPDLHDLSSAVKFARSLGDIGAVVVATQRELERRAKALAVDLAQLSPWTGNIEALLGLRLPSEAETASAMTRMATVETGLADARRNHQAASARAADLTLRRRQLLRDDRAVPAEAVDEARSRRDHLWAAVRAHLFEEAAIPDVQAAAADFETRKGVADALADLRFTAAEQSARLAALQDDIERNALALEQAADAVKAAEAAVGAVTSSWRGRLPSDFPSLTPTAFSAWSERRRRALESARARDEACDQQSDAKTRLETGCARLVAGLRAVGVPADGDEPFSRWLEIAERFESAGLEAANRRTRILVALGAAEQGHKRSLDKVAAARDALEAWNQSWAPAVTAAGLSAEASYSVVRAQLAVMETFRESVASILDLNQRIRTMEQDVADFGSAVLNLAADCALETGDRTPGDLLGALVTASSEATALKTRRGGLDVQLMSADRRLTDAEEVEFSALARLSPLTDVAGTTEPAALRAAIETWERARALKRDIARFAEDVVKAGSGRRLDALLAESRDADADHLATHAEALTGEVARLSNDIARLSADRAKAQADLDHLDAGPDAAIAASEAEQAKAEMAIHAEAYVRKRAEIVLLKWAIAKYRSERQNPLLSRASAIFSHLTLGRYRELLVDLEADKARLAGVTEGQVVVPVEGMSEGTVDQLFLALRLAAVEEAVDQGSRLPFLADDLFVNYDDERSAAGFQVLAGLARKTQVLFFTHHQHLTDLARLALGPEAVSTLRLD